MMLLSYVPDLKVNFGKSGRAQSMDLNNFNTARPAGSAFDQIPLKKGKL